LRTGIPENDPIRSLLPTLKTVERDHIGWERGDWGGEIGEEGRLGRRGNWGGGEIGEEGRLGRRGDWGGGIGEWDQG